MKIGELERNDVDGALAYARERVAEAGAVTDEDVHVLQMLQDDPRALNARLRALLAARPESRLSGAPAKRS